MKDWNKKEIKILPVNSLKPDPAQPRKYIDEENIKNLAESIKEEGITEPIKFVQLENEKIVISGQLRWEAAKLAGLEDIPGIEVSKENAPIIALIDNISQTPMLPMEEAQALNKALEQTGKGQNELAKYLGIPKSSLSEKLTLIKLPNYIQEAVLYDPKWTAQNLRMLAKIEDSEKQREAFEKLKEKLENKNNTEGKKEIASNKSAKWEQNFDRLNSSSEKFKTDFEKRIKKIIPEDELGKYSERIQKIYSEIDELLGELKRSKSNKEDHSKVVMVPVVEEENTSKIDS